MVVDEVQAGMARTGGLFVIEHWDMMPDIITTAKGKDSVPCSMLKHETSNLELHVLGKLCLQHKIRCREVWRTS